MIMTVAREVIIFHCRYCGEAVNSRSRHESKCEQNPANKLKKKYAIREWQGDKKLPTSINMLERHVRLIQQCVEIDIFKNKSSFIRALIEYVIKHPKILEEIQHDTTEKKIDS
jgi:hypothetical protein